MVTAVTVLVSLAVLLFESALCGTEIFIDSMAALIDMANSVNDGTSYSGTTIFLSTDLDFSGGLSLQYTPAGYLNNADSKVFSGTFDGQGYMINNLVLESGDIRFMGLFGYSTGATIRNLVMGPSCSMTISWCELGYQGGLGSVIGYCYPEKGDCLLQSLVNLATIKYTGTNPEGSSYLGGIAGWLYGYKYEGTVINCANYGDIYHMGDANSVTIGGLVGMAWYGTFAYEKPRIRNCFNAGRFYQTVQPKNYFQVGGIVGYTYTCYVENCISIGTMEVRNVSSSFVVTDAYGIVGYDTGHSEVRHCFWTNLTENTDAWYISTYVTDILYSELITGLNISFVNQVIEYSNNNKWNKWLYNEKGKNVTFRINGGNGFSVFSDLILLPTLTDRDGLTFNGWFSDEYCSVLYEDVIVEDGITLYGGWKFTVTFNPGEGSVDVKSKDVTYGNLYGDMPKAEKAGAEFYEWYSEEMKCDVYKHTKVTLRKSHELVASWSSGSVFFDPTGGSTDTRSKGIVVGKAYGELPVPEWVGYEFLGWFTERDGGGERIYETTVVTKNVDHTLYANWTIIYYKFTFDFSNGTVEYRYFNYGQVVVYPTNLQREGYEPGRWNRIVDTMPSNEEEAYVIWDIASYSLTLDFGNDTVIREQYEYGQQVNLPSNVEREGYNFLGWNETIDYMPGHDVVLSIKWDIKSFYLTLDYGNGTKITTSVKYNSSITYPENPERKGYEFNGWSNKYDYMPAHNVVSVAQWDYIYESSGGRLPIESSGGKIPIGSSGVVPIESSGKVPIESSGRVPAESSIKTDRKKDNTTTIIIIVVVLLILLIIIAIILALLFIAYARSLKDKDNNCIPLGIIGNNSNNNNRNENDGINGDHNRRIRIISNPEDDTPGKILSPQEIYPIDQLYPEGYTKPELKNALCEAGLTEDQADNVCNTCGSIANRAKGEGKLFDGLTKEDVMAIAMYTFEFDSDDIESNPYRIINKSLSYSDQESLKKIAGVLCLLMTALRKLPRVSGISLYRGVRGNVNLDKDHYYEGNVVTWPSLTSTTPDIKTTKTFLAIGSKSGKAEGTLFIIENAWGYNIQPYSMFPNEIEIIIEPGQKFTVQSVIESEGITIITLRMIDSPLIQIDAWK